MIVRTNNSRGINRHGALQNFSRIDFGPINGAGKRDLVCNNSVPAVEIEHIEYLLFVTA